MRKFNVIHCDVNRREICEYDIMPYFVSLYKQNKKANRPKTFDECKEFIKKESMYMFWSRCEHEVIIHGWPNESIEDKWDIHKQIMMNLDLVTEVFMENIFPIKMKGMAK